MIKQLSSDIQLALSDYLTKFTRLRSPIYGGSLNLINDYDAIRDHKEADIFLKLMEWVMRR
jgi:hypothetical protein